MDEGSGPGNRRPRNVWTRRDRAGVWDDEGFPTSDLHFHRYGAVWPLDSFSEPDEHASGSDVEVRFLSGPLRWGLRHTPALILFWLVVFLVGAELSPTVGGVGPYLASVPSAFLWAGAAWVVLWMGLFRLAVDVGLVDSGDLKRGSVVYGLIAVLTVGTVVSLWLVFRADDPQAVEPHVVFVSGYLLTLLVGGLFLYDTFLRTENLFENLDEKSLIGEDPVEFDDATVVEELSDGTVVETRTDAYGAFKESLRERLSHRPDLPGVGRLPVPTVYLFAPLFVSQFAFVWWVQNGPQNLDMAATLVGNVFLDLFLVAAAFQLLVLTRSFHELITDSFEVTVETDGETREERPVAILGYDPLHPDGRGGYRELGKFAAHVNVLLIVGGLYLVYRLYVQAPRALPTAGLGGIEIDPSLSVAIWVVSYVLPIVLYAVTAGAWLYYSFWHLHLKMVRERERGYDLLVGRSDGVRDALRDLSRLEFRRAAPVWPVNAPQMTSLVSGTLVPLILSISNVFL